MKRFVLMGFVMVVFLLVGCTKEKEIAEETTGLPEENILTSRIQALEEQKVDLIEQRDLLEKGKDLFSTFSNLSFEFMRALQTGDLLLLESVVSEDFLVESTEDEWFYITKEPIHGNNKIPLYNAKYPIKYWNIDNYGQIPDNEKYGMSIRVFTEENIQSGVPEVINLTFEEIDGEWKIIYMDIFV